MTRWTVADRRRRLAARHLSHGDPRGRPADAGWTTSADDRGGGDGEPGSAHVSERIRDLCARLVGLHATDPVTVYLQVRARMPGVTADDVAAALYDDRTVVRTLGMRRTMFVVDPVDMPMLFGAVTEKLADRELRRVAGWLEADGVADDGVAWMRAAGARVLAALVEHGPMTARELKQQVPETATRVTAGAGKWATEVAMASRVLSWLAVTGRVVRGSPGGLLSSTNWSWAAAVSWLPGGGPGDAPSTDEAAVDLARRYLAAFGPATFTDLQWWTGWTKTLTRRALEGVDPVVVEVADGRGGLAEGFALPGDEQPDDGPSDDAVVFLPALDLTPMGWKQRGFYLGDHGGFPGPFFDSAGNVGPSIWHRGRMVGAWGQRPDGDIRWRLLDDLAPDVVQEVEGQAPSVAAAVTDFLGDVHTPRFPTPWQRDLSDGD